MDFSQKLMELRRSKGMSQEQLGEKLGVTRQTISKWELGQTTPEMEKLAAISELFGITTDELIKGEAPKVSSSGFQAEKNAPVRLGLEYKSSRTVRGIPLVHVNVGLGRRTAKGIIAVGNKAVGVISAGFLSVGVISAGLLCAGVLAIGTLSAGIIALGAVAAGVLAFGGVAVGVVALEGLPWGYTPLAEPRSPLRSPPGDLPMQRSLSATRFREQSRSPSRYRRNRHGRSSRSTRRALREFSPTFSLQLPKTFPL